MRVLAGILVASAMTACVVATDDDALQGGNGKADGNNACELPQYGDGTCHIDLACDVPDIDCYVTFESDAAAATWLQNFRGAPLAETDAKFQRGRKLLDQAWAMYQKYVPIGTKLAEKRIALVVPDNPDPNAFVFPDQDGMRGGFMVAVHAGQLADDQTDLAIVGTLLHEFKHLTGLHWLPEVAENMEKHYIADGTEPLGYRQANNPRVEAHLENWLEHGMVAGDWPDARLGGVPMLGDMHSLMGVALGTSMCSTEVAAVDQAYAKLDASLSKLDASIGLDAAGYTELVNAFYTFQACWILNDEPSLEALATANNVNWTLEYLTPDEKMKASLPAPQALWQIVEGRRKAQRDAEAAFTAELGKPWTAARYFTCEEQADDTSMQILVRESMDARAANEFFLTVLGDERAACEAAVAAGNVPYGAMLSDLHHGTCWRYAHGLQIIDVPSTMARDAAPSIAETREPRIPRPAKRRLPLE